MTDDAAATPATLAISPSGAALDTVLRIHAAGYAPGAIVSLGNWDKGGWTQLDIGRMDSDKLADLVRLAWGAHLDHRPPSPGASMGTMLLFKVTDNCWHGHKSMVGPRHSLQLNYLSGIEMRGHERLRRRFAKLKRTLLGAKG